MRDYFRGEIHCHSTASDGAATPGRLVRLAWRKGLRLLSVTDHDTFRGSDLALRISHILAPRAPIILPGVEVRTDYGDILVYCPKPEPSFPNELLELREWADSNGCILVAAHPFHYGRHAIGRRIYKVRHVLDGVEVWNSRGLPLLNLPAMRFAEKTGMPATSGSDAHVPRELAVSPTIFMCEPESAEEALECIRRGQVRPTLNLPRPAALAEAAAWALLRRTGRAHSPVGRT